MTSVMRFYRTLLHLYPASFRAEYGEEMAAIFRHRLRDAGGPAAALALLCVVVAIIGSPASWWALVKLFLVVSGAILLGSVPGVLLWSALLVRKGAKLVASAKNPR